MDTGQIICGMIFLILAVGAFVISYLQFKEKGFLFNNAYFWASQEERRQLDKDGERKSPYYRQSGFAFMFIGIVFLIYAVYIVTGWTWMHIAFWTFVVITVVHAAISSAKIEKHNKV